MDEIVLSCHHRPGEADHPPQGKRRFLLRVEYDGTAYCGWQRQSNGPTVQATVEDALLRLTGEKTAVTGSSRTDAGVHARGLCAHFDSASRIPPEKLAFALNSVLPEDVRIRESGEAPDGFHARYSACGKVYRYRFFNARHSSPMMRLYSAHVPVPLDERLMDEEAQALVGTHDFAAFAASGSTVRSTVRTIYRVNVRRSGDEVVLTICGDGFLYNMVRIIAGTLLEVGSGKRAPGAVDAAIRTKDRLKLGQTAPAQGLTLERVLYAGDEAAIRPYFD